ncbi:hypothetical protein AVEN_141763-1 [Araneus ventricosus]|uniref:Uncharacterized protein n=1 Tax=Araneus ventricosus TaxID=182803 RepID=A0A4Y2NM81_ARAVE|nr:hypothetical protein AVEN_141763-1 [Araneus ventricosus]
MNITLNRAITLNSLIGFVKNNEFLRTTPGPFLLLGPSPRLNGMWIHASQTHRFTFHSSTSRFSHTVSSHFHQKVRSASESPISLKCRIKSLQVSLIRHSHCYKNLHHDISNHTNPSFSHHSLIINIQRPISIFPATIINNGVSSPHQHR